MVISSSCYYFLHSLILIYLFCGIIWYILFYVMRLTFIMTWWLLLIKDERGRGTSKYFWKSCGRLFLMSRNQKCNWFPMPMLVLPPIPPIVNSWRMFTLKFQKLHSGRMWNPDGQQGSCILNQYTPEQFILQI